MSIRDEVLTQKVQLAKELGQTWQIVITGNEVEEIAKWMHETDILNGHFGPHKTYNWLQRDYYHPNLQEEVMQVMWSVPKLYHVKGWRTGTVRKHTDELIFLACHDGL